MALVGAGMSKFGAFKGKTSRDLFVEAFVEMLGSVDKGIDPRKIEAFYVGNYSSDLFENQGHIAPILANWVGLSPIPAVRVEDACASAGVALRQGILAIASGLYDIVLVAGVEKDDRPAHRKSDRYPGNRRGRTIRDSGRVYLPGVLCRHGNRVYGMLTVPPLKPS